MSSTLLTIVTVVCTVQGLIGMAMLAGAMPPAEEKAAAIEFWSTQNLPAFDILRPYFFLFVGSCKLSGAVSYTPGHRLSR